MSEPKQPGTKLLSGPLAWFARNSVAANIIMAFLVLGGALQLRSMKKEVFPEFDLDKIIINVPYPSASPEEVEDGVLLAVEEQVRGVNGVKDVTSTAAENVGVTVVDLQLGTNVDQALNDIKAAVDRVTSFPEDVEQHVVFNVRNRQPVISLVLYGEDKPPEVLKEIAERIRDGLLQDSGITVVELQAIRPLEISIEIPEAKLREYNLTLAQVAAAVRQASIDLPAGSVKTTGGEVRIRMSERRRVKRDFEDIVLFSRRDGTNVRIIDIEGAKVKDTFADIDLEAIYRGKSATGEIAQGNAIMINVFREGSQAPLEMSATVKSYLEKEKQTLPPGVHIGMWLDWSELYEQRVDLLMRNALLGLLLVLLVLGLFLEVRLAFWVTMGIPISFVGALLFLPATGVSINMISLFAFIIVLGMVVDDAIVVGESIYQRRQQGMRFVDAAVAGVKDVAAPVVFAIVTTILAYMPLLFVPGIMGKFFRVVPIVVIAVLILSLIESLLILPAHLAHSKKEAVGILGWISKHQRRFSHFLEETVILRWYQPVARLVLRYRYVTVATGIATFIATMGIIAGGRIEFHFFPKVEGDVIFAHAELPFGTSVERSKEVRDQLLHSAIGVVEDNGGEKKISRGIYAHVGDGGMVRMGDPAAGAFSTLGSHYVEVAVYLVEGNQRPINASEFIRQWKKRAGDLIGVEKMLYVHNIGPQSGSPIALELSHSDNDTLHDAATALARRLEDFQGVQDIDAGFSRGKEEINLKLTAEARAHGLRQADVAQQIRARFFGAEINRHQRDRDEIKEYVRLPKAERISEYNLEQLILRTPGGGEFPFEEAVTRQRDRAATDIRRINGRRAITVTADVDQEVGQAREIMKAVLSDVMPALAEEFPGLAYKVGGEQQQSDETNESLALGFLMAIIGMFALLAIAFRSYVQPLIILIAIPFGMVGAVWGHLLLGYALSLMSMMGIVALSGVVINDSLILIVAVNERRRNQGQDLFEAVVAGCLTRFRPILLTSLTTFFGLVPMLLETSVQAKFLIPMAVSLAFGVMFATVITLILVPSVYLIVEDLRHLVGRLRFTDESSTAQDVAPSPPLSS